MMKYWQNTEYLYIIMIYIYDTEYECITLASLKPLPQLLLLL